MPDPLAGLPPRFLRTPEAARFLGLSGRTLEKHRTYGTGPKYRKIGGRVVYCTRRPQGLGRSRRQDVNVRSGDRDGLSGQACRWRGLKPTVPPLIQTVRRTKGDSL